LTLTGRTDTNKRCVIDHSAVPQIFWKSFNTEMPLEDRLAMQQLVQIVEAAKSKHKLSEIEKDVDLEALASTDDIMMTVNDTFVAKGALPKTPNTNAVSLGNNEKSRIPQPGDYLVVRVKKSNGQVLYAEPIAITHLTLFYELFDKMLNDSKSS
jgi:hypothetical protein